VWCFVTVKSCVTTDDGPTGAETRLALPEYCDKSELEIIIVLKMNLLTLFKEIIAVYFQTHKRPVNTKCTNTDLWSRWYT
jgi:hypothetical protein